jgi:hypothetical protein
MTFQLLCLGNPDYNIGGLFVSLYQLPLEEVDVLDVRLADERQ